MQGLLRGAEDGLLMSQTTNSAERHVLRLLKQGHIRLVGDAVEVWHNAYRRWQKKTPVRNPTTGRMRFKFGPARSHVHVSRVLFILQHQRPIQEGCRIDHVDGCWQNDSCCNLAEMSHTDSCRQGYQRSSVIMSARIGRWFLFVSEHGREPETGAERSWVRDAF